MLSRQDKLFSLILLGILVLGTLSAVHFPFNTYAQNDTYYYNEPSSDGDTEDGIEPIGNPNAPDQSSDRSTNDEMSTMDTNTSEANGSINSDPIADAGVNLEMDENSNVVLDGSGSTDRDGEISSYSWTQVDGQPTVELIDADSAQPSFAAPNVESNQQLTFQLTVGDNDGLTDTDTVNVLIRDNDFTSDTVSSQTQEPSLPSAKPLTSEESPSINCSNNETDCRPGEVTRSEPIATFPPPGCVDNQNETCNRPISSLTDCNGNESSCTPMKIPTTTCGNETDCTTPGIRPITCEGNNTDCNIVKQLPPISGQCKSNDTSCIPTGEPSSPDCSDSMTRNMTGADCNLISVPCKGNETGCNPSEVPSPNPCKGNETLCDQTPILCPYNQTACNPIDNKSPVANAGREQYVKANSTVTLDATQSYDPDGNITSYVWEQTDGTPVTLEDADKLQATFIAPFENQTSELRFQVTVTDDSGTQGFDSTGVFVNASLINEPPIENITISLNQVPESISYNETYSFSGTVNGLSNPSGRYIEIKAEDGSVKGNTITFDDLDKRGDFIAEWAPGNAADNYTIFAAYEDQLGNIIRSQAYHINVIFPVPLNTTSTTLEGLEGPYIKIRNSDWNQKSLNVYVIAKDEYSRKFIPDAVKAINDLSNTLRQKSGNSKVWDFNIFTTFNYPGWFQTIANPINIAVELKHEGDNCDPQGFWGVTYYHNVNPIQRILNQRYTIVVYTGCDTTPKPVEVYWTTMHEMHHAMGLGHTWHELGDMMCSREPLNGEMVATCDGGTDSNNYNDNNVPTEFDTRAVLNTYGSNGFERPNKNIIPNISDRYYCIPLPCESPSQVINPEEPKPPVIRVNEPKNPTNNDQLPIKKKITTVITSNIQSKNLKPKILSDLNNYRIIAKLGAFGSGPGQFNHPAGISGDGNGQRFYVADLDNNRVEVIHRGGNYITEWGTLGTGKGQFNGPGSIAVDNNHKLVFVSDIKNNRIEKFDTQGNYIGQWGKLGTANGQFDHPGDIALDPDKEILYVTDIYNNRIQSFYYDGNFINQWGSFGQLDGQFNRPAGITINPNDSLLYVSDTVNNRIQVFYTDGKFLKKWGSLGVGNGQFARPDGIFFEQSEKAVYIADRQNSRIQVFDDQGAFITSWKVSSGINGASIKPRDITMDPTGQLYIADKDNSNILVYSISASNASNELISNKITSQSLKSNTDSSSHKSSASNNKIDSNDNADKGNKDVKRPNRHCDSSYPDFCIPSPPPDLDCPDISHKNFKVGGSDPHGFDRDGDGKGCESSSGTGQIDENPTEAAKGKIQVTYGDVSGYNGKANIELKNLDTGKTLVNAKLNFGKQYASQGDHCCVKTYDFEWKSSSVGDHLGIKVTGGGGSWEDNSGYKLKKGTTKVSITLDEIGE